MNDIPSRRCESFWHRTVKVDLGEVKMKRKERGVTMMQVQFSFR